MEGGHWSGRRGGRLWCRLRRGWLRGWFGGGGRGCRRRGGRCWCRCRYWSRHSPHITIEDGVRPSDLPWVLLSELELHRRSIPRQWEHHCTPTACTVELTFHVPTI